MCADLDDAAVFHGDDDVGVGDGAQAVRNDERRSAFEQGSQRGLDELFAFGVEIARRFVEDEDLRVGEDGAGDGKALALPAGEFEAAFADERVVALGKFLDELMRVGAPGGVFNVGGADVTFSVRDVVGNRSIEEEDFLLDDR